MSKGSKYSQLNDEQWLYQKYWIKKLSIIQIAEIVGCDTTTVYNALKRLQIKIKTKSESHLGKHHTEKTKRMIAEIVAGEKHPFYGKHHTEEAKQKISNGLKGKNNGEKNPFFGKHHTEETKAKLREARKHQKFPKHHTKPELIFEGFCKRYYLPFKYTGDGSFWIGKGKDTINPDFIHLTKKIVIEIFSWHHDQLNNRHVKPKGRYEDRKKIYKKYGYKMIVFWQEDLEREDAEARMVYVLRKEKIISLGV